MNADDLPTSLVKHELGHLLGGILAGATVGTISHDGLSWRCDLVWPMEQPTEAQVLCPHIVGCIVAAEHASAEDKLIARVAPREFHLQAADLAVAVYEELDRQGPAFLERVRSILLEQGTFTMRRTLEALQ